MNAFSGYFLNIVFSFGLFEIVGDLLDRQFISNILDVAVMLIVVAVSRIFSGYVERNYKKVLVSFYKRIKKW